MKSLRRVSLFTILVLLPITQPIPAQAATKAENAFLAKVYNSTLKAFAGDSSLDREQSYYLLGQLEDVYSVSSNRSLVLSFSKGICSRLNKNSSNAQLKLAESFAARELYSAANAIYEVESEDDLWLNFAYVNLLDEAMRLATAKGGLCPKQASRGSKLYKNVNPLISAHLEKVIAEMYADDSGDDEYYDDVE
jgi:hypothetical protein